MKVKITICLILLINSFIFTQEVIKEERKIKISKMKAFEHKQNTEFFDNLNKSRRLFLNEALDDFINAELGGIKDPFYYYRTLGDRLFKTEEQKITMWESKLQVAFSPTHYHKFIDHELTSYLSSLHEQREFLLKEINFTDYENQDIAIEYKVAIFESNDVISNKVLLKVETAALTDAIIDFLIDFPDYIICISIILSVLGIISSPWTHRIGIIASSIILILTLILSIILGSINSSKIKEPIKNYYSKYYDFSDQPIENEIHDNINIFYTGLYNALDEE